MMLMDKHSKKGRWAGVAEEMAEENLLRDGLDDELREHVHQFRQHFTMKDSFDDKDNRAMGR